MARLPTHMNLPFPPADMPGEGAAPPACTVGPGITRGRATRIAAILMLVVIVSVADLYLTVMFLRNGGMAEGNPIARWVMSSGCAWLLSLWKVALVGFTCAVLWRFRTRRSAEVASWVCFLMMSWLVFQWSSYTERVADVVNAEPEVTQTTSWVVFND